MFLPTISSRERKETSTADVINLKTWKSIRERNIIHKESLKYCPQVNEDTESFKRTFKELTLAKLKMIVQAKVEGDKKTELLPSSFKTKWYC